MKPETLRVMTYNLWHGGDAGGQPLQQTALVIRAAGAQIAGLQETHGLEADGVRPDRGRELAQLLGWEIHEQEGRRAILTPFSVLECSAGGWGARLRLESGRQIYIFNAHLAYWPYQPYQVLGIPYEDAEFVRTEEEVIQAAREARGEQIRALLADMSAALNSGHPVFLTGDLNEPSHQDWTEAAAGAGLCPMRVSFPSTRALTDAGLRDVYRQLRPDEVRHPGYTWTPLTSPEDPQDHHDRIDFIFLGGSEVEAEQVEIIGEDERHADIVVSPYPSDHRALVGTFRLSGKGSR